jgi:MOSC domain-containing protein YiiM
MALLQSVNIGKPEKIGVKPFLTGIFKRPAAASVVVGPEGIEGDAIIDRKHHGGPDQAIYIYFADDYDWWSTELGEQITPGTFGDNLTIEGVTGRSVSVGDRFVIGDVILEVTSHRTPCMTLAARMGDPGFIRRFHKANRPGAYCRVIVPGSVAAGAEVVHERFAGEPVTVAELMALDGVREIPPATLRRALAAPVHYKMRQDFEHRLARLF